jgi:hypothetical protein
MVGVITAFGSGLKPTSEAAGMGVNILSWESERRTNIRTVDDSVHI